MNYPNLAAAVATRYPNANERTRDRLCRSALHETAHLFVARLVDANPTPSESSAPAPDGFMFIRTTSAKS